MGISDLPALNATLNGVAGCFLAAGYVFIRRKHIAAHRACMITAFTASTLFLISYVVYHAHIGSRSFPGQGGVRQETPQGHRAVIPMALITLRRGLKLDVGRHRRIARWTWPLWMYVSVTGVVIYLMLYKMY